MSDLTDAIADAGADVWDLATGTWAPTVFHTASGPVAAAAYRCEYRHQEEAGVADLRHALCGTDPRTIDPTPGHTWAFTDAPAVGVRVTTTAEAPTWSDGTHPGGWAHDYDERRAWAQGYDLTLGYAPATALRHAAHEEGLPRPWPRRRAELADALAEHRGAAHPTRWPGWFRDGRHLILRADDGVAADLVEHLAAAARAGTLTVAPHGYGTTAGGPLLYDAAELGDAARAEWVAACDTHDAHMDAIAGHLERLSAHGWRIWYCGDPAVRDDGTVEYFLNAFTPEDGGTSEQLHVRVTADTLADPDTLAATTTPGRATPTSAQTPGRPAP